MQNYNNLLTGLRVQTQIPLDVKQYVQNELTLSNLGISNNLAFTYVKGLVVYCIDEGTRWEWKPSLGSGGLLAIDYVYPANIIAFGVIYSNQAYNFYQVVNSSQVNSDWNATSGIEQILNKPTIILPPLEAVDDGAGIGYRLRGRNPANYGAIGEDAVDFSYSDQISTSNGSTGINSFSSGINVKSSGYLSNSFGYLIDNSGSGSFNGGFNVIDRGYTNSLFGTGHNVTSMNTTVLGQASNIISEQILDYNATNKPMLVVGNGTIANNDEFYSVLTRSDAFKVMFNGSVFAPSLTTGLITSDTTGKILITKEYLSSIAPTGSETKINAGTNVTISGTGTIASPYIISSTASGSSEIYFDNGLNTTVSGIGTLSDPYIISATDTNTTYSAGTAMSLSGTTFNNTSPDQTVVLTQSGATTITGTYPNFTISSTDTNTIADGSETKINSGTTTAITGVGTTASPYTVETVNLQKVITASYTLTTADNNYTILVNNSAVDVTITIPTGLMSKINVGFIQQGSGSVTFVAGSGVTINTPISGGFRIKGINYNAYVEQINSSNVYHLLGNIIV